MQISRRVLCTLALLVAVPASLCADTAPLVSDAFFAVGSAGHFGSTATVNVGGAAGYQGLLQFDLSKLPAGLTADDVANASLRIFVGKVPGPGAINVYAASGIWDEATLPDAGVPAQGNPVAMHVSISIANTYIVIPVATQVKAWMSGAVNNGFLLAADGATTSVSIDSKENQATSHAEVLEIDFAAPAGPPGPAGAAGPAGGIGPRGPDGAAGPAGPAGPAGVAGPAGAVGDTGAAGPAGPVGIQGIAGSQGPFGPFGPVGPKGDTGPTGFAGLAGPAGLPGPNGPVGAAGPAGLKGIVGTIGPSGPKGPVGPVGLAGPAGLTGAPGSPGALGPAGPQGPRGPMGPPGAAGVTGLAGTPGLINNAFSILTPALTPGTIASNDAHNVLLINNTSAGFVAVTLPPANVAGKVLSLVGSDFSASGNSMRVSPQGPDKILSFSAIVSSSLSYQANFWLQVVSDGAGIWRIVAGQ
jgi:hypothetical protein